MTLTNRTLLISDLHLMPERPDVFQAFRNFIHINTSSADALYILGDLFNLWIGDDGMDDFSSAVAQTLAEAADRQLQIYLMHGNRDFLMGDAFARACHASLISDPAIVDIYGNSCLLMHGDTLCTRDREYMNFRDMVRTPQWQKQFLGKPLDERQAYALEVRTRSKSMSSNKAEDIMDVNDEEVSRVLKNTGKHTLIHGHTHRPAVHDLVLESGQGKRIVLGDWDTLGWYVEVTPSGCKLESFSIQT